MPGNRKGAVAGASSGDISSSTDDLDVTTPNLFDGPSAALDASWPLWRMAAEEFLEVLAESGREFSADQLVEEVGTPPITGSPNAIGGLFSAALRQGMIRQVGYRRSTRASRHGGLQRVYVGT